MLEISRAQTSFAAELEPVYMMVWAESSSSSQFPGSVSTHADCNEQLG
jgi:hypothetical protein